jgi:hypothetical protein
MRPAKRGPAAGGCRKEAATCSCCCSWLCPRCRTIGRALAGFAPAWPVGRGGHVLRCSRVRQWAQGPIVAASLARDSAADGHPGRKERIHAAGNRALAGRAAPAQRAPARRRGRHLGHAGGQLRLDVQAAVARPGRLQPDRLLVAPAGLEDPDADARTRMRSTLSPSSTRRTSVRSCSRFPPPTMARSPARHGRWQSPWRTSGRPAWTRARAASTSSCRRAQGRRCLQATSAASRHVRGYALLRSIPKSGSEADVARAVAYGKRIKLYPLSQAAEPPRRGSSTWSTSCTTAPSLRPALLRVAAPHRAGGALARAGQGMIDPLRSIGIEKGKPFEPDPDARAVLEGRGPRSARLARGPVRGVLCSPLLRRAATGRGRDRANCWKGRQRSSPSPTATRPTTAASPSRTPISPQAPGQPARPICWRSRTGRAAARRRANYRLRVPPTPAGAAVLVGHRLRPRHARADASRRWPSRSSQTPGLQSNPDGSVDVSSARNPRRPGVELGSDERRRRLRGPLPLLRPGAGPVRQELALPDIEAA